MAIFNKESIDKYKGKTRVLKTMRLGKETAIMLDELQDVCSTEMGKTISQNTILVSFVTDKINEIATLAKEDENKARQKLLNSIGGGANARLELATNKMD